MIFKNYYKILGLEKNVKSTQEEIKDAYRNQAKKYHPDVNVNNKNAEERFKDINEAYRVLSDVNQKKKYDKSWNNYVGKKLQRQKRAQKEVNVNDIMNMFFGDTVSSKPTSQNRKNPVRGENIETEIEINIKEGFDGSSKKLEFNELKNKIVHIDIPAGVKDGQVIRIKGKGKPGKFGGDNGDILVKIKIVDNSKYKLVNDDIFVNLPITPWDAVLGGKVSVDGIDGEITILIPRGTQSGDRISIPNKGYFSGDDKRGNLIIVVSIVIPKILSDEEKELWMKLKDVSKFKPEIL